VSVGVGVRVGVGVTVGDGVSVGMGVFVGVAVTRTVMGVGAVQAAVIARVSSATRMRTVLLYGEKA